LEGEPSPTPKKRVKEFSLGSMLLVPGTTKTGSAPAKSTAITDWL
jgi:hypothetical protein